MSKVREGNIESIVAGSLMAQERRPEKLKNNNYVERCDPDSFPHTNSCPE